MRPFFKSNIKKALLLLVFFIIGIILSFPTETYYRKAVRSLIHFSQGDKIVFIGKNFHFFASIPFLITSGLFFSFVFLLLSQNFYHKKWRGWLLITLVFILTHVVTIAIDSFLLILACTACHDGILRLPYSDIKYDFYFVLSVVMTILALCLDAFLQYKKYDDLIGVWSSEDDGSGLIQFYGCSIEFNQDGTGHSRFWSSLSDENICISFLWIRLTQDAIHVQSNKESAWTPLVYTISESIGAYRSIQMKLTEKNKMSFWTSSEPLFKKKI